VPVAEVTDQRPLFDALGFEPARVFTVRSDDVNYFDFAPVISEKIDLRSLIENDRGVQARVEALRQSVCVWWTTHAPRLAELPTRRNLNAVRTEFLDTFVATLLPLGLLDRFKLAGVIASWWTDTLPDLKTLLENGFSGVIDGWVDAIADAVEDDEAAGPTFDPFTHKLVRRMMTDYLEQIAVARADIARLKGEKQAFEQSNPLEDVAEEELENWNYAKDLERQIRELREDHRDALKELAKIEKKAAKARATDADRQAASSARTALQPVLDRFAELDAALLPYEQIKKDLSEARTRYRELTNAFVDELRERCAALTTEQKRELVLDLFSQDVQSSLDSAVGEECQTLVRFVEGIWDKYRVTLSKLRSGRDEAAEQMSRFLQVLRYQ
jgi:type I restriction enzyme M protein